jgi:hypothetical protein
VIKAPKFASKVYEKSLKVNSKSGRNDSNVEGHFGFVFQPTQTPAQSSSKKVRLSSKRNSMAPSTSSYPTSRESSYKAEEAKRGEAQKRWERPSVNRTNLKINIKGKEIKEPTRPQANLKLAVDKHQRSKNDPTPDFESLLADNVPENNAATERHTSTLIENFDQSEFIRNVIIQSKKLGGNRFGSPGQANPESAIPHHRSKRIDDK